VQFILSPPVQPAEGLAL